MSVQEILDAAAAKKTPPSEVRALLEAAAAPDIDGLIRAYVERIRPKVSSIFANAQMTTLRMDTTGETVATLKCPCCGAARPEDTNLRKCSYCGHAFFK